MASGQGFGSFAHFAKSVALSIAASAIRFILAVEKATNRLPLTTSAMPKMSKDPNKPRGKLSPYNIFLKEEREAMKKSETDSATAEADSSKFVNFSKACAEKWKTLSEEEKQPFIEAAAKDKIRYENEMANYTPPKKEGKARKAKKTKDPNLPKGPK